MRFGLEIPAGWEATDDGEVIEIAPPGGAGAAHVSSMRRTEPRPAEEGEADEQLDRFLDGRELLEIDREPERAHGEGRIAIARYTVGEQPRHWVVAIVVTAERALLCTFNHSGDGARHEADARRMFEAATP